jgi:hypothetical protein
VVDGSPVLVFNGHPDGDNDVYWADGAGFANPINLTEAGDAPNAREDFAPALAIAGQSRAIAYLSMPSESNGEIELHLVEWSGEPTSPALSTLISGKGDCDDPSIVADPAGKLHVLSACGPLGSEKVEYATNASGTWEVKEIAPSSGDLRARIAITPDGKKLFGLWQSSGGNQMLASSDLAGNWTSAVVAQTNAYSSILAVDPEGLPLIAFHRDNAQSNSDVFLMWSTGAAFHQPILLTPETDGSNEWMPSAIAFEPKTGLPEVLYVGIETGSDPLNSDVYRAKAAPH